MEKVIEVVSAFPVSAYRSVAKLFGREVLYLAVFAEALFTLHQRLVNAVSPSPELINRYFELGLYTPHLTLGQTYRGMEEAVLEVMKSRAENALSPYPAFTVTHLRVYKSNADHYEKFEDIPLGML